MEAEPCTSLPISRLGVKTREETVRCQDVGDHNPTQSVPNPKLAKEDERILKLPSTPIFQYGTSLIM